MRIQLKVAGKFAITFDAWSDNAKQGWLAITAHYWTDRLTSGVLGVRQLYGSHTAAAIADTCKEIFEDMKVSLQDVITAVTDNAQVIIAACNLLNIPRSPCLAHLLQLAMNSVLSYPKKKVTTEANLAQEIEIDIPDVPELQEYRIDEGDYEEPNSNDEEASNQNATTTEKTFNLETGASANFKKEDVFSEEAHKVLQACLAIISAIRNSLVLSDELVVSFTQMKLVRHLETCTARVLN